MGLIDNDRVILFQEPVTLCFGQKNAIRHQFDGCLGAQPIRETDFITDNFSDRGIEFPCDAVRRCAGSNPAWLGVSDQTCLPSAEFKTDFRQLGRFAGTCFSADHDDLMIEDGSGDFIAFCGNWQLFRVGNGRNRRSGDYRRRLSGRTWFFG